MKKSLGTIYSLLIEKKLKSIWSTSTKEDKPLTYWDRYNEKVRQDSIYADWFIKWCYENEYGKKCLDSFFSRKSFNLIYGLYKNSKFSIKQIQKDIHDFNIEVDDYQMGEFKSYSDFFLRKFKAGKRPITNDPNKMPAFAEGRYLGFNKIELDHRFPVKGQYLNAHALLEDIDLAKEFIDGPILICRLCPIDYHHFHFPDNGKILKRFRISGKFHSVNVLALRNKNEVFCENEREITVMETEEFGKIAYIEVGAMCVGKIIQENPKARKFKRGQLKGHFEFGASTVIVLGQKNKWKISKDVLKHSNVNRESFVKLGDEIAYK